MSLGTLSLLKEGDAPQKLRLNLQKTSIFNVELYWDSQHDLDAHALEAVNGGDGAKVTSFGQVLSTYNWTKTNPQGMLKTNPDGKTFSTTSGALTHSGDARSGVGSDVDEVITIDGMKVPAGVNEIPIFITIHPSHSAKFSEIKNAGIRIKNDQGAVLKEYVLSTQFGSFDAVQMGSLMQGDAGWEFVEVAVGFNGDFNSILESFS